MKNSNAASAMSVIALTMSLLPLEGFAKDVESKKSLKLLEAISLIKTDEVIKGAHPYLTKQDKKVHVVGRQRTSPLDEKTKILQVVWTGLQNAKNQHAAFEKPFVTVIQSHGDDLPKDLEIPFEGDLKQLDVAYKKLKSGKVNEGKGVKALNPESDGRRVQGGDSSFGRGGGRDSFGKGSLGDSALDGGADPASGTQDPSKIDAGSTQSGKALPSKSSGSKHSRGGLRAKFQPEKSSVESKNKDVKTVDIVACDPRIDEGQRRVYLQNKTVHKTNGSVTSQSQCEDSLKFFSIRRDYNGDGCSDYVNRSTRTAYDRYLKYWINGKGERLYISNSAVVDDEKEHPFIDEKGSCSAALDERKMTAHPQVETVYYGRGNKRIEVETCHKDMSVPALEITETNKGCEPLHNIESRKSTERKRGIYHIGDIEYQAFACHPVGAPIPHEFNTASPCRGIKNLCTKEILLTGKRFVTLSDGSKFMISGDCEPSGENIGLDFSIEGCKGYKHDIDAGKSYAKGKWSYQYRENKKEISACVVGPISYAHTQEIKGFEHEDAGKVSYKKQRIGIKVAGADVTVEHRKVRYDLPGIPYQFKENRFVGSMHRPPYFEGCFMFYPQDKYRVFKRCDGSEYLSYLNAAADAKSVNLCPAPPPPPPPPPERVFRESGGRKGGPR